MSEQLVTVASFSTALEAHLAKGKLESSGIWATVFDEQVVNTNWMYSNAIGGVKVKVHERDIADARAILRTDSSVEEVTVEPLGTCPLCGNTEIECSANKKWTILTWLFLGVPLFPVRRRLRCKNCGNEWKSKKSK